MEQWKERGGGGMAREANKAEGEEGRLIEKVKDLLREDTHAGREEKDHFDFGGINVKRGGTWFTLAAAMARLERK